MESRDEQGLFDRLLHILTQKGKGEDKDIARVFNFFFPSSGCPFVKSKFLDNGHPAEEEKIEDPRF